METAQYDIVRTLRCKITNAPGNLGKLTTTIGKVGANIGNITTVHVWHHYAVRDLEIFVKSREHLAQLVDEISNLTEITVLEVRDDVLDMHKNGKIKMVNTASIESVGDLRRVYTPGVAEVCRMIKEEPSLKDVYTSIPYSVAIVTDGTAILGLGDIGPVAGMPVMDRKVVF